MLLRMAAEVAATGALVIGWFHGLSLGKSCCPRSVGTVRSSSGSSWSAGLRRAAARLDNDLVLLLRKRNSDMMAFPCGAKRWKVVELRRGPAPEPLFAVRLPG